MINFSKSSLHYKFNKFVSKADFCFDAIDCKSLCGYFWQTIWNIVASCLATTFIYSMLSFIGLAALGGMAEGGVDALPNYWYTWYWLAGTGAAGLIVAGIFCLAFSIVYPCVKVKEYFTKPTVWDEDYVEPKPNLVLEWLKAKKEKVCPLINFK